MQAGRKRVRIRFQPALILVLMCSSNQKRSRWKRTTRKRSSRSYRQHWRCNPLLHVTARTTCPRPWLSGLRDILRGHYSCADVSPGASLPTRPAPSLLPLTLPFSLFLPGPSFRLDSFFSFLLTNCVLIRRLETILYALIHFQLHYICVQQYHGSNIVTIYSARPM